MDLIKYLNNIYNSINNIIEYVNNESINMEDFNYVFSYTNVPENSIFS